MSTLEVPVPPGFDFVSSLRLQRMGYGDPTTASGEVDGESFFEKAGHTPDGTAAIRLVFHARENLVRVSAWGDGASWALARVPGWLGAFDDVSTFRAESHPLLERLARQHRGMRIVRSPFIADVHATAILQQRVTWDDAKHTHRWLVARVGESAPELAHLKVFPDRRGLDRVPRWALMDAGLDRKRAAALFEAARLADRVARIEDLEAARKYLMAIPGTGPWTTEVVMGNGFGDADAVTPVDVNLPHHVVFALSGESPGSDARMFELLEPFRGHRYRVIRLLWLGGPTAPRPPPTKFSPSREAFGLKKRRF